MAAHGFLQGGSRLVSQASRHSRQDSGQSLGGHAGHRRQRQDRQAGRQDSFGRLLPDPDDVAFEPEIPALVGERLDVPPRRLGPVRRGPQHDRDRPDRQPVTATPQGIIPMQPLEERPVPIGQDLRVDDHGVRAADPDRLVGLGGERREIRVDSLDLGGVGHGDPEGLRPFGRTENEQLARRRVVRPGHRLPPLGIAQHAGRRRSGCHRGPSWRRKGRRSRAGFSGSRVARCAARSVGSPPM